MVQEASDVVLSESETGVCRVVTPDHQYSQIITDQCNQIIYYPKMPISQKETNLGVLAYILYKYTVVLCDLFDILISRKVK